MFSKLRIQKNIREFGTNSNHSTPNTLTTNGKTVNDAEDLSNMFNDYFVNLSKVLLSNNAE